MMFILGLILGIVAGLGAAYAVDKYDLRCDHDWDYLEDLKYTRGAAGRVYKRTKSYQCPKCLKGKEVLISHE